MKKNILILFILLSLLNCKTSKIIETPPFTISKATYTNWFGGREGVKGIRTEIKISNLKKKVEFKFLYFKNKKEILITKSNNGIVLTSNINISTRQTTLQMHHNPQKEYGNSLPNPKSNFPFKLKENEAVINYILNKKEYFYKLKLEKGKDLFYP